MKGEGRRLKKKSTLAFISVVAFFIRTLLSFYINISFLKWCCAVVSMCEIGGAKRKGRDAIF
jgi:hypothetical protein